MPSSNIGQEEAQADFCCPFASVSGSVHVTAACPSELVPSKALVRRVDLLDLCDGVTLLSNSAEALLLIGSLLVNDAAMVGIESHQDPRFVEELS